MPIPKNLFLSMFWHGIVYGEDRVPFQYSILLSVLTSVANDLLNDVFWLDNELSAWLPHAHHSQWPEVKVITIGLTNFFVEWLIQRRICLNFRPAKTTEIFIQHSLSFLYYWVKLLKKYDEQLFWSYRFNRCNFTKDKQGFSHCICKHPLQEYWDEWKRE